MGDDILAVVEASPARRWVGIVTLAACGAVLLYVAFGTGSGPLWQAALAVLGGLALWVADRMRRATEFRIELTATELRDSSGARIARLDDIASLESGAFALKPSNGFSLKTKSPATHAWRPGMWWRFGRRIGIGGVTPKAQAKHMTSLLSARLAAGD